jgi:hypothetical protein
MSESAKIILIDVCGHGFPISELLEKIASIKEWDNGNNYPIQVHVLDMFFMDTIDRVEKMIKWDQELYIREHVKIPPDKIFKTGGKSELILIDDPFSFNDEGQKNKRRRNTNFTPKKKKRK